MAGMALKEIDEVVKHASDHGVQITKSTKGYLLRFPDGSSTMLHLSGSDYRERMNVRARFRRAGIPWIDDGDPLPDAIAKAKPLNARKIADVRKVLRKWEQSTINASQLMRIAKAAGVPLSNAGAQRALLQLGWRPSGPATRRKWNRPLEPETKQKPTGTNATAPAVMFTPPPVDAPITPIRPDDVTAKDDVTVKQDSGREFIDSVESWCADPTKLPAELTIGQILAVVDALGLKAEFRTWRAT